MEKMGTKADTLRKLYNQLEHAEILPQICFTVKEWKTDRDGIMKKLEAQDWNACTAVRSSSLLEDTQTESRAGQYETVLNVTGKAEFECAVEKVLASYDSADERNQVLVQPMLDKPEICGVAFTMDPNTLGHYYVVNYDDTGSTSAVTSGSGRQSRLYYQFKDQEDADTPPEMKELCRALKEIENFFGQENLDVEFAVVKDKRTKARKLYILQVRTLCLNGEAADIGRQKRELKRIQAKIAACQETKPFLCGKKAVYSVMTDWNPAEMIGIRPKPLALSLYREIITDNVWAYQRDNYGYRNMRSFPLLVDFGGLPYIDVRVSFNSFVPAELDQELSEKLVNYYIDRLVENPQKHDKAEFEIVFSCYTMDLPERIQILSKYGFSDEEIQQIICALRNVTNHIIDHKNGLWRKDYEKIEKLNRRYYEIIESGLSESEKIYWLLEDCKRYGTLPFAGLARGAFVAVQILQSLMACGILTKSDYEKFMNGVDTVSSGMSRDFRELSKEAFLKKYGHLRPGTYDITSLRYDEAPELYFDWNSEKSEPVRDMGEFRLSLHQLNLLKDRLCENGLTNDVLELLDFIKTVIEGREYGKFIFTRNLSRAVQMIHEIGQKEGISREDCAYINIRAVYELYSSTRDIRESFLYSIKQGKDNFNITQSLTLPPVIISPEDAVHFYYMDSEPNFITSGKVRGSVCVLQTAEDIMEVGGRIVLIQSADPGYDWVFSHGIAGFITMYGGANSHMAIRAGELGVPAAVGVGAKQFSMYEEASVIELNAQEKTIKILK